MSKVVIIGGSGHVGTYLVPRLVEAGHEVVNVSRGRRTAYSSSAAWNQVLGVALDREAEEQAGTFGRTIRDLKPDIVIDMICFKLDSAKHLAEALKGQVSHFLHCGTIWVHGPSIAVPTTETTPRNPFGEYGIQKAAIEAYLLDSARRDGFPATVVHPGHIVGPGWNPLNPAGHFNPQIFTAIARGAELALPNFGLETVHHVHADDVAQVFVKAIASWSTSVGEAFNAVSPAAVTLRGYAEAMYAWFGTKPRLRFLSWPEWKAAQTSEEDATATLDHIARSPCHSIAKAERLLGYAPRYTSFEAVCEAVTWLIGQGIVNTRCEPE
jgi:nucleoside-diphosphate-sugar epimerase